MLLYMYCYMYVYVRNYYADIVEIPGKPKIRPTIERRGRRGPWPNIASLLRRRLVANRVRDREGRRRVAT